MKKIAFTLLAFVMLFTAVFPCAAFAEVPDFSDMTDEEIQEIINAARNALAARKLEEDGNTILLDQDDVQLYLTGNYEIVDYGEPVLELEAVVINNTDHMIGIRSEVASINGWDVEFFGASDVSAGKKKKCDLEVWIGDADISTFEEVEDFEISFVVYECENFDTLFTSDLITVQFD